MASTTRGLMGVVCFLALTCMALGADTSENKVLQFKSAGKGYVKSEAHLIVLACLPHGRVTRLTVPNTDGGAKYDPVADQAQFIAALKPGDLIKASWTSADNVNTLSAIDHFTPKPGQMTPNGYLFLRVDAAPSGDGKTLVLDKLGDLVQVPVPMKKDASGDSVVDPAIDTVLSALQPQDPVWVDLGPESHPTLMAILPYTDPQTAKLVKIENHQEGGETQITVDIAANGATISAVIPHVTVKDKTFPYPRLVSAARRCSAGSDVLYRIQRDGLTTVLRDIEPVPTQTANNNGGGNGGNGGGNGNNGNTDANGIPRGRTIGGGTPGVGGIGIGGF